VVRIDGDGEFLGSGFLVAPGEVLTCAHVVHGRDALTVTWGGSNYQAEISTALPKLAKDDPAARFYPLPDVALLRLVNPPQEHPCVRFDLVEPALGPPPDVLHLAAHTIGEHQGGTLVASGATLEYEGPLFEQGFRLLKLKGGQIVGGYSGGPLLNTRTGGVCALVDSSRGERDDLGGFGVPLSGFLDRIDGLAKRNAAFHRVDRRWERAVIEERRLAAERAGERDRLPLDPPFADELVWEPGDPPSDLLRPRYAVVPFIGRENLLAQLMLWRETDVPLGVAVLTGAGGTGKTRTASEVCVQAQRAGWTVGRLADTPGGWTRKG
jgi:hypothetical protein